MNNRLWRSFQYVAGAAAALLIFCAAGLSTMAAPGRTVAIDACLIQGPNVFCNVSMTQVPESDDGYLYLYADEVYQDGPVGAMVGQVPLSNVSAQGAPEFSFPLNLNQPGSRLSQKFLVAVKYGGRMVQVSNEHYITNPEAAATVPVIRNDHGIKGILADPDKLYTNELDDLNLAQASYNIYICDLCGETSNPAYPTVYFTYDGVRYPFDGAVLAHYDDVVRMLTLKNLQVTVNILNKSTNGKGQDLIHPLSRDGHVCPNYAFNTVDPGATQHLKAIAAFLAERYNGYHGVGQIDNWIVGNEVNARTEQYYMGSDNLDYNVNTYQKAFRIFYNRIKSINASARIYNSIDQEWNRKSNPGSFLAKEYLDLFNYYVLREGNIDWGLSFHPYNSPLYDPYAWLGYDVWVHQDIATPYITMQNFYLLTDYMQQPLFLSPNGTVRSISLSEIGFTSSYGEELQAASIVYAYEVAKFNPYIDSFMLFRLTDDAHEMESMLAEGLDRMDGTHKLSYEYYKYLETPLHEQYVTKASGIIGQNIYSLVNKRDFATRGGWKD